MSHGDLDCVVGKICGDFLFLRKVEDFRRILGFNSFLFPFLGLLHNSL